MFEIRHILVRMRQGDSDRALAKAGLIGRPKAKALRLVAKDRDWLDPASLPCRTMRCWRKPLAPHRLRHPRNRVSSRIAMS